MIEKLTNNILINDKIKSVYSFNDYSIQDLLSKFFEQINSVTDLVNQNEEKINTQNFKLEEFINYMKNEGIPPIVIETVTTMYNDGRLTELFNNLANNVIDKVEKFKTQVNSSLEHIETKIKGNFINILEYQNLVVGNDWSIAIQKAIDDTANLNNMCEIIFPDGTYEFSNTIIIKNNTKIIGRSKEYTILKYTGNGTAFTQEHSETMSTSKNTYVNNIKLYDFTLLGTAIVGSIGLWLVHGGNHKYSNLRVDNFDINVILGSKVEQYSLLFSEFQFDTYNAKNISLLIRHIEDCIFPRNLIAGGSTKCERAIQIGDVTNNGNFAKPFDVQFNMCVFQGAKVGVYHDGGYSVNFFGGHCEGLDKMVVQSGRTDRGLNFTGMTISQTVLSVGDLSLNGFNLETNGISPKIFSTRLFSSYTGQSIPCRTSPYDADKIQFKIPFDKWQIGAFRIVAKFESTVTDNKTLRILDYKGNVLCTLTTNLSGNNVVTGEWKAFIPNNTMPNTDTLFYLQTIGENQTSGTINLFSLDLQGTQYI